MDGEALLLGVELTALEFPRMLNVLLALQVRQIAGGFGQPYEVLEHLLAAPELAPPPTLDTWGMSAEAQAAQDAFMRLR